MCARTHQSHRCRHHRCRHLRNGKMQVGAACPSTSIRSWKHPPRRRRQSQEQSQGLMPDWTDGSYVRYGSNRDSNRSVCAISGAYHRPSTPDRLRDAETISMFFFFCIGRNECDPDGTGSLDRDAFARGMVRIDEELRKAQLLGRTSAGWGAASAAQALRLVPSRPIPR